LRFGKFMNTQPVNIPRASLALMLLAVLGGISLGLVSLGSISSHPPKDNKLLKQVADNGDRSK
jgi:hypothetical protein